MCTVSKRLENVSSYSSFMRVISSSSAKVSLNLNINSSISLIWDLRWLIEKLFELSEEYYYWLAVYELFILINEFFAFDKWISLFEILFRNRFRKFFETFQILSSIKTRFCHTKRILQLKISIRFSDSCYCSR